MYTMYRTLKKRAEVWISLKATIRLWIHLATQIYRNELHLIVLRPHMSSPMLFADKRPPPIDENMCRGRASHLSSESQPSDTKQQIK